MDDTGLFSIIRLSDGKLLKQALFGGSTNPVLTPSGDVLFLSSDCRTPKPIFPVRFALRIGYICKYSADENTFSQAGIGYFNTFLDYDPKTNTAFVPELFNGWVSFVDLKTQKVRRRIYLEPFIWRLVFEPRSRILTVNGYFKGNLYQVDVDSGKVLRKVYIGKRPHWMYLSRDRKGIYVATTQGVFFVELAVVNKQDSLHTK